MVAARSSKWDAAVTSSHEVVVQVDVLRGDSVLLSLTPATPASQGGVIGGSVEVERTLIRRQATLNLVDPGNGSLIPETPDDALTTFGNELRIWRGIRYPDGTTELIPVFTGPIADVEETYPTLTVKAYDRADIVQRHRLERPYAIGAGTNYVTAIQRLLEVAYPAIVVSFPSTTLTTPPLLFEEQGDPWEHAKKMAASLGNELLFDPMGTCVMTSEPDPTLQAPLFTYVEGDNASFPTEARRSTLLGVTRTRTNRGRFNKVIVTGEHPDTQAVFRAEAWDADTSSPTYVGGSYGVVPRWYASSFITNSNQAAAAARSVLRSELGQTDAIPFEIVPNEVLDIGDVIRVVRPKAKIDATRAIDKFSIPLDLGSPMPVLTRSLVAIADTEA